MRILITGAAGFINGYLVPELLEAGHEVIGVDDYSKYGRLTKSYDDHPRYRFVEGDAKDTALLRDLAADVDQVVASAAMIGGISYFHEFAYDLMAENERILASTFDAAIAAHREGHLQRIIVVSSSMVYESATVFPTPEGAQLTSPPPISTYGFQKLASEYFAKGAWEQYQLPYTIVRPFNCVGIGERRALRDTDIMSGNVKLALSHVVPDLVLKVLKGQDPLHILGDGTQVRHYTYGGDLAHGIRLAMESDGGLQRGRQPLHGGVHDRHGARDGDLAQGQRPGSSVPLRLRSALRARRPAPGARRPEGPRPAGLRGDHVAVRDARRGRSPGSGRKWRPAGCDPPASGVCTTPVSTSAEVSARTRSGARSSLPPALRRSRMRRSSTSPATVGTSCVGRGERTLGDRHPRRLGVAPDGRPVRPGLGLDLASAVPTGYFGTVFMSNYLEHLQSSDAVDRPAPRRCATSCDRVGG